jgi:hypothetical protein
MSRHALLIVKGNTDALSLTRNTMVESCCSTVSELHRHEGVFDSVVEQVDTNPFE